MTEEPRSGLIRVTLPLAARQCLPSFHSAEHVLADALHSLQRGQAPVLHQPMNDVGLLLERLVIDGAEDAIAAAVAPRSRLPVALLGGMAVEFHIAPVAAYRESQYSKDGCEFLACCCLGRVSLRGLFFVKAERRR